jgi:hypothetical protein
MKMPAQPFCLRPKWQRPRSRVAGLVAGIMMALLAAASPAALAQDGLIGFVKTVTNQAMLVVDGQSIRATAGMPLQAGFVVKTGPDGSMGVTLRDDTLMSFGPNTEFVVDEYLYAPGKGELKLSARIVKGTLQYVSGIIAKLKPEAVTFRTPTGVIGVRGTEFLLLVEDGEKS